GGAAQARPAARAAVGLAVEHQAARELIVEEVAQRVALQLEELPPLCGCESNRPWHGRPLPSGVASPESSGRRRARGGGAAAPRPGKNPPSRPRRGFTR